MKPGLTALLTAGAMTAFASNSLLCRAALADRSIDTVSFTSLRLLSGALMLMALSRGRGKGGSWVSAGALAAYALGFSIAYLRLSAGTGALILFGTVQVTMIVWGLLRGERPPAGEWLGLAMAVGGLVALTLPGLTAPDPLGAALMAGAGLAWGVYTVRGKGVSNPLAATAENFLLSVAFAALATSVMTATGGRFHCSAAGAGLAVASGAVTSGLGYVLWYAALRGLSGMQAAVVQLTVAPLVALGGIAFLGEQLTMRLIVCSGVVLGGIALTIRARRRA